MYAGTVAKVPHVVENSQNNLWLDHFLIESLQFAAGKFLLPVGLYCTTMQLVY